MTTEKREQFNLRLPEGTRGRLDALAQSMGAALGIRISLTDVWLAGLAELERRYPPPAPKPQRAARKPSGQKKGG